jgi:adenylyltransferase/sulfurtransferase
VSDPLSSTELARYRRHLALPGFGAEAQQKLKDARVLVVGVGGLGAPLLSYLVAAGVGTVGLVDFDVVAASNLHRQVLFTEDDVGRLKTEVAAERLGRQNPHVRLRVHNLKLSASNALGVIRDYDIVADGSDNFATRYLVNDACVLLGKVNAYAAIFRFEGQVAVFNYPDARGERSPNYRDLFPQPPLPDTVPSCAAGGVLGVLPGMVGSMQANEVIKIIAEIGEPLAGRLLLLDALSMATRTLTFRKNPDNPLTGTHPTQTALIDYEQFCGEVKADGSSKNLQQISAAELRRWQQERRDFQLVDVREPHEHAECNLGGVLIPSNNIERSIAKIATNRPVVVYCQSGARSQQVIRKLKRQYGFANLYSLEGGLTASMPTSSEGITSSPQGNLFEKR